MEFDNFLVDKGQPSGVSMLQSDVHGLRFHIYQTLLNERHVVNQIRR
jgi:hypothetical protein